MTVTIPGPSAVAAGTVIAVPVVFGRVIVFVVASIVYSLGSYTRVCVPVVTLTVSTVKTAGRVSVRTTLVASALPLFIMVKV